MKVYEGGEFDVSYKGREEEQSPLTRADTEAHHIIVEGLHRISPGLPVLSEESQEVPYSRRKGWKSFWLVDPLDGTKEFIKKTGEFTVNIALIDGDRPVLGVVHAPAAGVTYSASEGMGAFKAEGAGRERIRVSDYRGHRLRVVASVSHRSPELEAFIKRLGDCECLSMGSSLKLCLVAEGRADLYPRLGPTMEWDTAAAQCVVECAGGSVIDLDGRPLGYNKPDLHNPFFMVTGDPAFPWRDYL